MEPYTTYWTLLFSLMPCMHAHQSWHDGNSTAMLVWYIPCEYNHWGSHVTFTTTQPKRIYQRKCLPTVLLTRQPFRCIYHCHPRHEKKKAVLLIKGQTQYKDFQQHFLKTEFISQQRLRVHHKRERWDQRLLATQYFILSFHFLYLFKTNNYWSWLHCSRTFGF